jgi:hypothetical protein
VKPLDLEKLREVTREDKENNACISNKVKTPTNNGKREKDEKSPLFKNK